MTNETPNQLCTKIFIGCAISSEIRMHLNHSIEWKHAALISASTQEGLQIVSSHGNDYLGFYSTQKHLTIKDLKETQETIIVQIKSYLPKLDTQNLKICIFPQVFVA